MQGLRRLSRSTLLWATIVFSLLTIVSCTSNANGEFEVMEGTIVSIATPSTAISGSNVQIEVSFQGMNGCSIPFNIKADQVGQKIKLRAYYKQPNDGKMCTEILPLHKLTYTFFADIRGVYFFESDSDPSITSTLTVY